MWVYGCGCLSVCVGWTHTHTHTHTHTYTCLHTTCAESDIATPPPYPASSGSKRRSGTGMSSAKAMSTRKNSGGGGGGGCGASGSMLGGTPIPAFLPMPSPFACAPPAFPSRYVGVRACVLTFTCVFVCMGLCAWGSWVWVWVRHPPFRLGMWECVLVYWCLIC